MTRPPRDGMGVAGLAMQSVFALVIAVAGGSWLENKYGFAPWGLVVGGVVGSASSALLIRELIRRLKKEEEKEDQEERGNGGNGK